MMAVDENDRNTERPGQDWYITDSQGRRIGYMWPEDLLLIIESIWGKRQGIKNFHQYIGVNRATVERWCNGSNPIPKSIALLALLVQREAFLRDDQPPSASPFKWLPTTGATWLPHYDTKYQLDRHPTHTHPDDME